MAVEQVDTSAITAGIEEAVSSAAGTPVELEADPSGVTTAIDEAVSGATPEVTIEAATDAITADIEAAVGAADTTVTVEADTSGLDELSDASSDIGGLDSALETASGSLQSFGGDASVVNRVLEDLANAGFDVEDALAAIPVGGKAALGVIGAISAVTVLGVRAFTDLAGEIRTFQRFTGASAEEASRFVVALRELGIEPTQVASALFRLSQGLADGTDNLRAYGIEAAQTSEGTIDLTQTFFNVADAVAGTEDPVLRNKIAFEAFGRAGRELIPVLAQGRQGLEQFLNVADRRNLVFSQDELNDARDFDRAMRSLGGSVEALQIQAGKPGVRFLANFLNGLATIAERVGDTIETVEDRVGGLVSRAVDVVSAAVPGVGLVRTIAGIGAGASASRAGVDDLSDSIAELAQQAAEAESELSRLFGISVGFVDAQDQLAAAQRGVRDAQEGLTSSVSSGGGAVKSATERYLELRSAELGVVSAQQQHEDAIVAVEEAQENLNNLYVVTEEELRAIEDAQRGVTNAQEQYREATDRVTEAQRQLAEVTRAATAAEADKARRDVRRAQLSEADALDRIEELEANVARAQRDVSRAQGGSTRRQALAAENLSDAERALEQAQLDAADAADRVTEARDDAAEKLDGTIGTAEEAREAEEALDEALRAQQDALVAVSDANRALSDAQEATTVSAKELDQAERELARAHLGEQQAALAVEQANFQLTQAHNGTSAAAGGSTRSANDLRDAHERLADAQRALVPALAAHKDAQDALDGTVATAQERAENLIQSYREVANTLEPGNPLRQNLLDTADFLESNFNRDYKTTIIVDANVDPAQQTLDVFVRALNRDLGVPIFGPGNVSGLMAGTNDWPGGFAVTGERGPEVVWLPQHSQVVPNNQTDRFAAGMSARPIEVHVYEVASDPRATAFAVGTALGQDSQR